MVSPSRCMALSTRSLMVSEILGMMSAMISGCSRASLHPTGRGVEADLADFSRGEMFHVGVCVALMNVRAALFWLRSSQNKAQKHNYLADRLISEVGGTN